jgi:peptidoglycan L-alanyl-D-glutamate endopeptidase CwlK
MRDSISLQRAKLLHPAISQKVIDLITKIENESFPHNALIRIVQGLRTIDEQNALYAKGRTAPGDIVTRAKGGSSFHNYGLAFDFAIMYDKDDNGTFESISWDTNVDLDKDGIKDWQEVVMPFKLLGFTWGGDFKSIEDDPHLERSFGYSWRELKAKYDAGDFLPNTKYVRL